MILKTLCALTLALLSAAAPAADVKGGTAPKSDAKPDPKKDVLSAERLTGLALRGIGPAVTSGRIADLAVVPGRATTYYVAVASGGVWKTTNAGTTFTPVFDSEASYSIGCVTVDPKNALTVWVGTGENNSQRSVAYGDGVYRSLDGGKTWENMGLKTSEHIGKIVVDPRASNVVFAAAQGPLWAPGGERGLYKTTDGGKSWKAALTISENTGVSDVWLDPRNPDVLYAAAYQRRRHVFTLINGGPESGIHKSTDGGATWKKLDKGLPKGDLGRIGLAIPPADPDRIYAIVEATGEKDRGFYRSTDAGGSWQRVGDHVSGSAQYYHELIPDPKNPDRVYSMDTWMMVTDDGGKTFRKVGEKYKHVDNHALWIDPENTDHLLAGCDGGIYESWDRAATWAFKANLPVTQFYRLAVDEALPVYNVYGGTQDNFTLGGPSRTLNTHGITNADWFVATGGDGFQPRVDPKDPNVVYAESQYGGLVRFDRRTGERIDIQPQPGKGEPPLRFNWDSPLLVSPHSSTRLYFAAQKVFRSDDRGDTWRAVSPDLTAQIDRNRLKVMGRVFSIDAVAKNASTSFYGNIVSLSESPLKEGLLWAGTDDGLVQVTEDGGGSWRKLDGVPGVPKQTYVSDLKTSRHAASTVYAAFDNHKTGDFKPYLLKSTDLGKSWTSIAGDLPARGTVYTVAEDTERPDLLFAGTEFGLYVTLDGGKKWVQLKGGLPTIAVRDLAIQARESDLVLATFGRGFFVLDDYTPLRRASRELLEKEFTLFPVKKAAMYVPAEPLGLKEKAFQGDAFYTAPNPPFGAVFTYWLKEELTTRKAKRQEEEKKLAEKGADAAIPSWDDLKAEEREEEPAVVLTVTDAEGNVVRRLLGPVKAGFHRVAWDLRFPPANPTDLKPPKDDNPFSSPPEGPMVLPGTYRVAAERFVDGKLTPLGEPQTFVAEPLSLLTVRLSADERKELLAFQKRTARLQRAVLGAAEAGKEAQKRLEHLKKALADTPAADPTFAAQAAALERRLKDLQEALRGGSIVEKRNEPAPPSIVGRVQGIVEGHWSTTGKPTNTQRRDYEIAADEFGGVFEKLRALLETDLKALEDRAETAGAPWTPGRLPRWKKE